MTLYALDDIGDAIDATKELLMPFDWWLWLRLGVVVSLIGGAGGGLGQLSNVFQYGGGGGGDGTSFSGLVAPLGADPLGAVTGVLAQVEPGDVDLDTAFDIVGPFLVAVVLLVVLAIVLFSAIGAAMEFVLIQSLRTRSVAVGADFGRNYVNGIRLTIFRYAVWLLAGLLFGAVFVSQLGTDPSAWTETALFDALVPLALTGIVLILLLSIVNGFTNVFVVPIMLTEDRTLLSAWGRFWRTLAGNLGQFLAYLVVSVLLGLGVAIVLTFAVIFAIIAVGIPIGILTALAYLLLSGPLLWVVGGVFLFVGFVAFIVATLFISVPLVIFLRYYALFVLGDVDERIDPIPDVRASVRGEPDVETV